MAVPRRTAQVLRRTYDNEPCEHSDHHLRGPCTSTCAQYETVGSVSLSPTMTPKRTPI